jgi:hypothetical protein
MSFDFELLLQVFDKLEMRERASILRCVNLIVDSIGTKRNKNGKSKPITGLLAVGAKYARVDDMLDRDYLKITIVVPRKSLYGMSIGEGAQGRLKLKQAQAAFDEPAVRKPRDIL